uniref:DNA polymerase eta n=1 Tax=Rhizophora mucronata TaxID=61149 RepID=A0A2P2IPL1_RHIMU
MPLARPESSDPRIIAHVDMDCFYVQVEQRKQPDLRGLPTAVVQYNEWKGGALIAVSYEARKLGVNRFMRGNEAKEVCPQIKLVQVPVARGKADLNAYRNAGSEVVSILASKGRCERASIDEVYLDLTDAAEAMLIGNPPESWEAIEEEALKSHILGLRNETGDDDKESVRSWLCRSDSDHRDKLLACGALIVAGLRMQVLRETEFTCSAGIAHNKMLAKLASAMNKPAQQTVVPFSSVKGLLDSLPIKKMKQLGGKLGTSLQNDLNVNTVGDLLQFSEEKLQDLYGTNTGTWLWNIARGISGEEVRVRLLPRSHGSGKLFTGPRALKTISSVQHWLNQLCEEISERLLSDLEQNKRVAHTLTLHASAYKSGDSDSHKKFPSRSCPLRYGTAKIQEDTFNLFQSALREYLGDMQGNHQNGWGITALSVSASKIIAIPSGTCSIMKYFHGKHASHSPSKQTPNSFIAEAAPLSPSGIESCSEVEPTEMQINNDVHCLGERVQKRMEWKDQDCSHFLPRPTWHSEDASPSLPSGEDPLDASPSLLSDVSHSNPLPSLPSGVSCSDASRSLLSGVSHSNASPSLPSGVSCSDASPSLPSGSESCLRLNQSKPLEEFSRDGRLKHAMQGLERQKRKINVLNNKGMITKFFKSQNTLCTPPRHKNTEPEQGTESSRSVDDGSPGACKTELPKESFLAEDRINDERCNLYAITQREVWSYKVDEIDLSVIDELPPEFQDEIRTWLRPHKPPNTVRRGPTIAHYFSPVRNTQGNLKG